MSINHIAQQVDNLLSRKYENANNIGMYIYRNYLSELISELRTVINTPYYSNIEYLLIKKIALFEINDYYYSRLGSVKPEIIINSKYIPMIAIDYDNGVYININKYIINLLKFIIKHKYSNHIPNKTIDIDYLDKFYTSNIELHDTDFYKLIQLLNHKC